jgi:hypothetical protein
MSDFDLYILKKYLFIPLLVLCIPILGGPTLQCGTLIESKMCTFILESTHFMFNKCSIYTHDGANAKFSTNTHKTDYSVLVNNLRGKKTLRAKNRL